MKKTLLFFTVLLVLSTAKSEEIIKNNYTTFFKAAYLKYPEIPKGILEAVSFSNTRFQHMQHTATKPESCTGLPNIYGVMGLTLNGENYFKNNLVFISNLSNYSIDELLNSPEKNILAYAAAYVCIKKKLGITTNKIEDQLPVLAELSELPSDNTTQNFALNSQLYAYYTFLNTAAYQSEYLFPHYSINFISLFGADNYSVLSASSITIHNEDIYNNTGTSYQNKTIQSADYSPALWNAAATCNYSSRNGTVISAVTIHTVQGTYAGCISWFKNCAAVASTHYVVRSMDGQVTQMVSEADKAWHARSESSYTIGIEHEGYINNAAWYTNAMYNSSAALVRDITNSGYGINPLRTYFGPGCSGSTADCGLGACIKIKGHQMFPNQTHTDPGPNWNWALYYTLINNNPTITTITTSSGNFYDSGGNNLNYSNDERTLVLIKPSNASSITINFSSFNIENNYDYLLIYDGANTSAPLIGMYTGTNSPGTITSNGGALLLEFRSDCATTSSGWVANWTSNNIPVPSLDHTPPTTFASTPNAWETNNFTATFSDSDNIGGSGLAHRYYQVIDFNGTEWRANSNNGFFADNFDFSIHSDWNTASGTWGSSSGSLTQSDETNSNSNIYTLLNQNISNQYLYNFYGKISGTGNTRRAGFHFFSDNGSLTNRGNSYFIWLRVDDAKLQIYKITNDVLSAPVVDIPFNTVAGQWYDYKIIFDRSTGKISLYRDNSFITSWIDSSPFTTGNAISFRSGNANFAVNELKVYRSRTATAAVSVGNSTINDIRYQNPTPTVFSAKVKSICTDSAGNLSSIYYKNVNIDWTPPSIVNIVNDGLGADITFTNSLTDLSANWNSSTDTNSAIARYWYAIGTTSGAADVVNWTDNWFDTVVTVSGLNLIPGQTYYFSIKSENGAGLQSTTIASNGQTVQLASVIAEHTNDNAFQVFPNPFTTSATVIYQLAEKSAVEITLIDVLGKRTNLLTASNKIAGKHTFLLNAEELMLSEGMYFIVLKTDIKTTTLKLIIQ